MTTSQINGAGVALRSEHFDVFLQDNPPAVAWLEIMADNYLGASSIHFDIIKQIATRYPVVMHCVNNGVGNSDPINWAYCQQLKMMANSLKPAWISDHLCWTALEGHYTHALLPLPFDHSTAQKAADKIKALQDYFGLPFLIENIAAYIRTPYDTLSEADFLNQTALLSDCGILLDVSNLYVNTYNHRESAILFLQELDKSRVKQYHLGGHQIENNYLVDTHDQKISSDVWALYQKTLGMIGEKPTCIEWDADIPAWSILAEEIDRITRSLQV